MIRAAIYARYSSDLQDEKSIEDQMRTCRNFAEKAGFSVIDVYTDHAVSGASLVRRGVQNLLSDAQAGHFDVVVSEALDRLSRNQAHIASVYDQLRFLDVKLITLSEGEINEMHIGLKGTMNAMYLKDLAQKTHRGLEGRALEGKSAGGKSYGYDIPKSFAADGSVVTGEREINEDEARIVLRIFKDYRDGKSPKRIAAELNAEGIPGPSGKAWGASTIYGNRQRGTGIINNEIYIGRQIWNKLRYVKDPNTGKRVSRLNSEDAWVISEVPHLRIVPQDIWDSVKAYQGELSKHAVFNKKQRPPNLLSHLLKCGECGGGMSIVSKRRYGCSTSRNKGTCDCRTTISQDDLEERVIGALRQRLLDSDLTEIFCNEYAATINRLRMEQNADIERNRKELVKIEKEMESVIQAIIQGVDATFVAGKARALEERKKVLEAALDTAEEVPVYVHPNMGKRYAEAIDNLIESLNSPDHRPRSAQIIRSLVERVVLTPNQDRTELVVDLYGDLAGILHASETADRSRTMEGELKLEKKERKEIEQIKSLRDSSERVSEIGSEPNKGKMVAGTGFEPVTFRL